MNIFLALLSGFLLLLLNFYLRTRILLGKKSSGCDAFYFLSSVEEFKRQKKMPYQLPYYFLDIEEQWYPPGFVVFLSLFSKKFIDKYHWLIAPLIDCVQLLILYTFTYVSTGNILMATVSGLIYAVIPNLNTENLNMNVRSFASLINTLLLLSLIGFWSNGSYLFLFFTFIFGFLLFMTHKMAVQNLTVVILGFSLLKLNFSFVIILLIIIVLTFILSKGFYLKVLKNHIDILLFWKKNLCNLGNDQYKHSEIYGKEPVAETKLHIPGIKGLIKHTRIILGFNPFVIFLVIYPVMAGRTGMNSLSEMILLWGIFTYLMVFLTSYVPIFRFLGEGWKYIKFAAFPVAFVSAVSIFENPIKLNFPTLVTGIVCFVSSLWITLKLQKKSQTERTMGIVNDDLLKTYEFIRNSSFDGIICIPTHLADATSYYTKKKVLWGGHSLVSLLEGFFPIIRKPIEYYIKRYNISLILIDTSYIDPWVLKISERQLIFTAGKYKLFSYSHYSDFRDKTMRE